MIETKKKIYAALLYEKSTNQIILSELITELGTLVCAKIVPSPFDMINPDMPTIKKYIHHFKFPDQTFKGNFQNYLDYIS